MMKLVVLSCFLAVASAGVLSNVPYPVISAYGVVVPPGLTSIWTNNNYRGPISLAPGEPADILAADGRPLDTLEVNQDRAAHLTAKALGLHLLKKRSAPLVAPLATPLVAASPLIAPVTRTLAYGAPWTAANWAAAPYAPIAYANTLAQWVK